MSTNTGSAAARAAVRAERISFYVSMGGPQMPNAAAAALLGVAVKTISNYRTGLLAAGVVGRRQPGPPAGEACGTPAASQRHARRGEPPCHDCRMARATARAQDGGTLIPDPREKRNNMPDVPLYQWRARVYPWALRAIAAAEAVHGAPQPTCRCGAPLSEYRSRNPGGQCETCEPGGPAVPERAGHVHYASSGSPACRNAGGNPQLTGDPHLVTCQNCARAGDLAAARAVSA